MHPILFHIGSFEMASYGLMMALAYLVPTWYLYRRLHYIKLDKDTFFNIIFIAFVAALFGAKILYLIVSTVLIFGLHKFFSFHKMNFNFSFFHKGALHEK